MIKSPTAKSVLNEVPVPVIAVLLLLNVIDPALTVDAGASLNSKPYSITSFLFSLELTLFVLVVLWSSDHVPVSNPISSVWDIALAYTLMSVLIGL